MCRMVVPPSHLDRWAARYDLLFRRMRKTRDTILAMIRWQLARSVSAPDRHSLLYRCEELGAWLEVHTGRHRAPERMYYRDGDPREYGTEAELREVLR